MLRTKSLLKLFKASLMITKEVYKLFCEYGGELLWTTDSRCRRPKGTNEETDKMFTILDKVDEALELLSINEYSVTLKNEFNATIINYKDMIPPEVFEMMENKYKQQ